MVGYDELISAHICESSDITFNIPFFPSLILSSFIDKEMPDERETYKPDQ